MMLEGMVRVSLRVQQQQVHTVEVCSSRPALAQSLLHGKNADDAITQVGLVFQLCAQAQRLASFHAFQQALGHEPNTVGCMVRQQLVHMENMREHLWRILLDWPALCGMPVNHALMKEVLALDKAWQACFAATQAFDMHANIEQPVKTKVSSLAMKLGTLLKEHIFYMPPKNFFACAHVDEYLLWARYTPMIAPQMMQYLINQEWQSVGNVSTHLLPTLDLRPLNQVLDSSQAASFVQQPTWAEHPCETTPYARQREHPLMVEVIKKFGSGLLARFTAVLLELAQTYLAMEKMMMRLEPKCDTQPQIEAQVGFGMVEAARGRLIHRVVLEGDKVKTYQIVAPTEWNFHPEGVLKKALMSLKGDAKAIEQQAKLLIHTMDPCVKFHLEVSHA